MDDTGTAPRAQVLEDVTTEMQAAVIELRAVLDAEREALDRRDSLALDAATCAKAQLLQRLESLEAERRQLDGLVPSGGSSAAWQHICGQLEACRHINEINGSIVAHRLRDVRLALGILRGSGEAPPTLYGPEGHARTHTLPRPLSQA